MVAHNNLLPNNHFRKDWQLHVKTWFSQPKQKEARRLKRTKRQLTLGTRPAKLLKPAVRCPTLKYNMKLRQGRGFTLQELKDAGIRRKEALTIGIAVDHRRKNRSTQSLVQNVARLQEYKARLLVFPKKSAKPKAGDATQEQLSTAVLLNNQFPVTTPVSDDVEREITTRSADAYATLRKARSDKKLKGKRDARRKAKEAEEADKKK